MGLAGYGWPIAYGELWCYPNVGRPTKIRKYLYNCNFGCLLLNETEHQEHTRTHAKIPSLARFTNFTTCDFNLKHTQLFIGIGPLSSVAYCRCTC